MKYVAGLVMLAVTIACSREEGPHRPSVPPALTTAVAQKVVPPVPSCTCNNTESTPAPSKWEAECDEPLAVCGDLHYAEYLARNPKTPEIDRVGTLLATHMVESMVYDATISFSASGAGFAAHDSTFRAHIGDVVPTPKGRARVVQVHHSFVEGWDDGRVTLHFLEVWPHERASYVYVSSGAASHIDGVALTMTAANGGKASVVVDDGGASKALTLQAGDSLATSKGSFRVIDVVNGVAEGPLGWAVIDTAL